MLARVSLLWRVSLHYKLCKKSPSRNLSTDAKYAKTVLNNEDKAYSNTLLLPSTSFKLQPDVKEIEKRYRRLTCDELYRWQVRNALNAVHEIA